MGTHTRPAFAVLRLQHGVLDVPRLSADELGIAVVVQKVMVGASKAEAAEEAARLNALNAGKGESYFALYARVVDQGARDPD